MAGTSKPSADTVRVVELRRASLVRAGYDRETAQAIAERVAISLADAIALRRAGFPPDAAYAMLTSRARPVFRPG